MLGFADGCIGSQYRRPQIGIAAGCLLGRGQDVSDNAAALISFIVCVAAAVAANNSARRKGRSRAWGVWSFLFPPILLILLLLPSHHADTFSAIESNPAMRNDTPPSILVPGTHVTTEQYQRSFSGKLVAIIFWGWQVIMAVWAISYLSEVGQLYGDGDDAEKAGAALGGTIGMTVIL